MYYEIFGSLYLIGNFRVIFFLLSSSGVQNTRLINSTYGSVFKKDLEEYLRVVKA